MFLADSLPYNALLPLAVVATLQTILNGPHFTSNGRKRDGPLAVHSQFLLQPRVWREARNFLQTASRHTSGRRKLTVGRSPDCTVPPVRPPCLQTNGRRHNSRGRRLRHFRRQSTPKPYETPAIRYTPVRRRSPVHLCRLPVAQLPF